MRRLLLYIILAGVAVSAVSGGCDRDRGPRRLMPTNILITINEGAGSTSDTLLRVSVTGFYIDFMQLSLDPQLQGAVWREYDTLSIISVPRRDGDVRVYGRFTVAGGDTSQIFSDGIQLDVSTEILRFDVTAANDSLVAGDPITFEVETSEAGAATVSFGRLVDNLRLYPLGGGVYRRTYRIPDGIFDDNILPTAHFRDNVGNVSADFPAQLRFTVIGEGVNPRVISSVSFEGVTPSQPLRVGGTCYLSAGEFLAVVNIANEARPEFTRTLPFSHWGGGLTTNGRMMIAANGDGGISIYHIDPPEAVRQVGRHYIAGRAADVLYSGDLVYVSCIYTGFWVVDPRDLEHPKRLGHLAISDYGAHMTANFDTVFVGGSGGFAVVDASDPYHPQLMSEIATGPGMTDLLYWEGKVFVASGNLGVVVVDVEDPARPWILQVDSDFVPAYSLALSPPLLFIGRGDRVTIVNADAPLSLPVLAEVGGLGGTRGMFADYHRLFVSANSGMHIIGFAE